MSYYRQFKDVEIGEFFKMPHCPPMVKLSDDVAGKLEDGRLVYWPVPHNLRREITERISPGEFVTESNE